MNFAPKQNRWSPNTHQRILHIQIVDEGYSEALLIESQERSLLDRIGQIAMVHARAIFGLWQSRTYTEIL